MPGGVGTWNLTGDDALMVASTFERTRVINNANTGSAYNFQAAGFVSLDGKIRKADGTLIATCTVSFTTDGSDGSIDLEIPSTELTADEIPDDAESLAGLIFSIRAIKSNGKPYTIQRGRADLYDQPTYT